MGRGRKTNGGRSHSRDNRVKLEPNGDKILQQYAYRKESLTKRIAEGKVTEKNWKEADSFGIKRLV